MSSTKQLNDQLPSPQHPMAKTIHINRIPESDSKLPDELHIKVVDNKNKNIPIRLPYIPSTFHTKINNQISESKAYHTVLTSNKKPIALTIDVNCVESSTSSKCSNTPLTIISSSTSIYEYSTCISLVHNNDKNDNNSNHNDSGSGSDSGGFGGDNNGNGNDDGNHKKDNRKDTNNDDEEDDDDEDEDKEEEKKSSIDMKSDFQKQSSNLNGNAEEYTPKRRSVSMLSTIEEHHTIDSASNSLPIKQMMRASNDCQFRYSPNGLDRAQGCIKITKIFTETIIPKMIEENIENVYDFMDKATAIAIYHKAYYDTGKLRVFNYGFHSKLDDQQVLYCIADKNYKTHVDNRKVVYVMREVLFTQDDVCSVYNLNKNDLPLSIHELKPMVNIMNYVKVMKRLFNEDIILKRKWHKQFVFNTKNNKTFNKHRYTFSITKNEFIQIIQSEMKKQNNMILIPIVMFNILSNGYRLEYVNIVHLRDNNSIGISYVCNNRLDDIQVTGIHLNKENLINQHLLAVNCNNCHCFDTFNSNIDELRIGNPDVDKNRCKDLKKKNKDLKQEKQTLQYKINRLENENMGWKRMFAESQHELQNFQKQLQYWKTLCRNIINITPSSMCSSSLGTPYSLGTPHSQNSQYTINSNKNILTQQPLIQYRYVV